MYHMLVACDSIKMVYSVKRMVLRGWYTSGEQDVTKWGVISSVAPSEMRSVVVPRDHRRDRHNDR